MIHELLAWLIRHPPGAWIHAVLAATALAETLFPPLPGDVLFVVLAGWCGGGALAAAASGAAGAAGCLAGTILLLAAGRRLGRSRVRPFLLRHLGESRLARAESLFERRGGPVLLASRFIPGIRSAVVVVAGYSGMKPFRAFCWAGGSALAWYALLAAAGAALGGSLRAVESLMRSYEIWFWTALCAVLLVVLAWRAAGRRR